MVSLYLINEKLLLALLDKKTKKKKLFVIIFDIKLTELSLTTTNNLNMY